MTFTDDCTRVYTRYGRVAHLRSTTHGVLHPGMSQDPDYWLGTGSRAEYDTASSMPLCARCETEAAKADKPFPKPPDPATADRAPADPVAAAPVPPAGATRAPSPPGAHVAGPVSPVAGPATPDRAAESSGSSQTRRALSPARTYPLPSGQAPSSSLRVYAASTEAGIPDPVPGTGTPDASGHVPVAGDRAEIPQTPGGGAHASHRAATSVPPAGSTGLRGKDFTDAVKAEQSRQARARRTARGRYVRVADRPAGGRYAPGMARRMPPGSEAR
jgi:hypothetical protein